MNPLFQSLLIYMAMLLVFASMVHSKGRQFNNIQPFELLFLFMPWLTVVGMAYIFFGSIDALYERTGIWVFFWIMQVIGAGLVGSFVLMPRYLVKADTLAAKLLVNLIASMGISAVFAMSRVFLFALSGDAYFEAWPVE
ncbi:hypothetical protein MMIC_P1718 [Mariprofundus micogutta]|uniref:Uncharacterized protein n=1 Tax=Mariprofundus micogutta TaxID=1921010 RepID=A0A1L8CP95_9PROT|nr:hypothetical protein [Mariprofundus micogutta]GAV20745.1 hypothetical protein MMIC_P1718 [Mariprofundus micogutta]